MTKIKNKLFVNVAVLLVILSLVAMFSACGKDDEESVKSGEDSFGRTYGEIYDIDEYPSGIYKVAYDIEDTSAMGKAMIRQYCEDYIVVIVDDGNYSLAFYCSSNMLDKVRLGKEGALTDGKVVTENDKQGYEFVIQRETLDDKMAMSCEVKLMGREVNFSIRADLSTAQLVG